jgi:hypothetical protein
VCASALLSVDFVDVDIIDRGFGDGRLLTSLLTQIERVLEVNELQIVSTEVVEAARDSLVIGQG